MAAVIPRDAGGIFSCLLLVLGTCVNAALVSTPWVIGWLTGVSLKWEQSLGYSLLLAASIIHLGAEMMARSISTEPRPQISWDAWYRPLALLSCQALLATYWLSGAALQWQTPQSAELRGLKMGAAIVFMLCGIGLRAAAIRQLGNWFVTDLGVARNQPLVSHGLYRWMRHPSETGLLLLTAGIGMVGGWRTCCLALAVQGMLSITRIYLEERALTEAWGDRYRAYARSTARVCPGVW